MLEGLLVLQEKIVLAIDSVTYNHRSQVSVNTYEMFGICDLVKEYSAWETKELLYIIDSIILILFKAITYYLYI